MKLKIITALVLASAPGAMIALVVLLISKALGNSDGQAIQHAVIAFAAFLALVLVFGLLSVERETEQPAARRHEKKAGSPEKTALSEEYYPSNMDAGYDAWFAALGDMDNNSAALTQKSKPSRPASGPNTYGDLPGKPPKNPPPDNRPRPGRPQSPAPNATEAWIDEQFDRVLYKNKS